MNNKIFLLLGEKSAYHSSFSLARGLVDSGYDVYYLVFGMEGMLIQNNGFKYHLIHPKERKRNIKNTKAFTKYYHLHQYVVNRKIEKLIVKERPQLCIINCLNIDLCVQFLKHKIPMVNYVNELISNSTMAVPPIFSSIKPNQGSYGKVVNGLAWARVYAVWWRRKAKFKVYTYLLKRQYPFLDTYDLVKKYGGKLDFCEYGYRLRGYDYFSYPKVLDTPGRKYSDKFVFGGSHVYGGRNDGNVFTIKAKAEQMIIYCSLGTWSTKHLKKKERTRFYRQLLDVFAEQNDLYLVLSVPKQDQFHDMFALPGRVEVHDYVPQLSVLKQCAVFITHGGISSLREAVHAGVPMIVLPGKMDQPGNAARVECYKLGVKGKFETITSGKLTNLISHVMNDEEIKASIAHHSSVFRQEADCTKGIKFIQNILGPPQRTDTRVKKKKIKILQ